MSKNFRANSFLVRLLYCCGVTSGLTCILLAQIPRNAPPARVLITRPIDSSRLRTLGGNTRPEANAQNDRGKVPDSFAMPHMLLQLRRSPEREQALRAFIDQQHDSSSPNFHQWLTADQMGQAYGPAPRDIEMVSNWLESNGFTVNSIYPSGMLIDFSGTAGQVQAAFHTEIHKLSINGQDHIANMSDPQIPEALAPVIAGVVSLHDFRPHSMKKAAPRYKVEYQLLVPADLATIYDFNPAFAAGYTGQGQTIAVLEDSDLYNTADWDTFRKAIWIISLHRGILEHDQSRAPEGNFQLFGPRTAKCR